MVWNLWTQLLVGGAGGVFSVVAILRLIRIGQAQAATWPLVLFKGAGFGALVTTATFVATCAGFAAGWSFETGSVEFIVAYPLALVSISTIGIGVVFMNLHFSLAFGVGLGAAGIWIGKMVDMPQVEKVNPRELSGNALAVALVALILTTFPFIGLALHVTAIILGFRAVREIGKGNWPAILMACLAIGIGIAGVAWWMFALSIFLLPS